MVVINGYYVSSEKSLLNREFIHQFLSQESYWAKGISLDAVEKTIENSLCFGVYRKDNKQVGYARVITDYATVAHIADVFISNEFRGLGLSKLLIGKIMEHNSITQLRKVFLFTQDAQRLYEKFGFRNSNSPQHYMEIKMNNPKTD
ncbi:MAG: GNAT family N-acetyltransferase [Bacteroidota bacterium]|jgi:N-acetylglutamate synthase-like GNAT family acetyltransferase